MRKIILLFTLLVIPLITFSKTIIVSDVDDTIRVSEVRYLTRLAYNHFFGAPPFARLVDIYRDIQKYYEYQNERVEFYYLTASSVIFDLETWLRENNLPPGIIQQKPLSYMFVPTKMYKVEMLTNFLKKIMEEEEGIVEVFLFGDSGQQDAYAYFDVMKNEELNKRFIFYPYIRIVYDVIPKLPGITFFQTEETLIDDPVLSRMITPEVKDQILTDKKNNELIILK